MSDEPDYILELSTGESEVAPTADEPTRPWIGVQFDCCGIYVRIYRNREATAYVGHCPRCLRAARIRVGPGGSSNRIFRAT